MSERSRVSDGYAWRGGRVRYRCAVRRGSAGDACAADAETRVGGRLRCRSACVNKKQGCRAAALLAILLE